MLKRRGLHAAMAVVGAMIVLLGTVGAAYAHGPQPPVDGRPFYGDCPYYGEDCPYCLDGVYRHGGWMRGGYGMGMSSFSLVDATAEATGLSTTEVITSLKDGLTFAQIAEAAGVDPQAIVEVFLAEREAVLEEAVAEGRLTQEQADAMLERMSDQISDRLEEGWMAYGGFDRHTFGGRMGFGRGVRPGAGSGFRFLPSR